MINLLSLKVSEYRELLVDCNDLQYEIVQIMKYACQQKSSKKITREDKSGIYALLILLNGDTKFDSTLRNMINREVSQGYCDESTFTRGNFWQKVKWWNVNDSGTWVSILFGDKVENISDVENGKAYETGRGISPLMKSFFTDTINDCIIGELLDDIKGRFLCSDNLKDCDKVKKIKTIETFVNYIKYYEGDILSEEHQELMNDGEIHIPYKKGLRKVTSRTIASFNPIDERVDSIVYSKNGIEKRKSRTERHQIIVRMMASELEKLGFELFEGSVDLFAINKSHNEILFEVKTLNRTYSDEVSQVRGALAQLLYYEMFEVKHQVKKVALFETRILTEHIDYLEQYGIYPIWIDEEAEDFNDKNGVVNIDEIAGK